MPPNRERAATAAGAADPRLAALLAGAGMGGRGFRVRALPGGFANAVWTIDRTIDAGPQGLGHRRVAKVFSELSRRRAIAGDCSWGDVALKRGGLDSLGAGLVYASREGVVHEWVSGNSLSLESLLAEGELLECMAGRLAQLHAIRLPRQARALFWGWLRSMNGVAFGRGTRPHLGTGRETLEREIAWAEAEVARAELGSPLVFCHGDLKPDNVIRVANTPGGVDVIDLRFIDLELAGPNLRGIDVAKLLRRAGTRGESTRPLTFEEGSESERALRAFAGHYCLASGGGDPERLVLEAKALLPLTWLEAHLFFRAALSLETCSTRQETLSELAEHRWECYLGTRAALTSYTAELRCGRD